MKLFNLIDALAGHPVVTRSGKPVKQLKLDAWGVYFLYPGIGLFTPGALQLETDIINID